MKRRCARSSSGARCLFITVAAVLLPACGGGSGGGGGVAGTNYSGNYFTTLDEPRYMLALTQTGNAFTWTLSHNAGFNATGAGTLAGTTATLTTTTPFPLTIVITFNTATSFSGSWTETGGGMNGSVTGSLTAPPSYDLATLGIPQFVTADYIDLDDIDQISFFRSSAGHDYVDDFETCRSMKHYYALDPVVAHTDVNIYSPVNGTVVGWMDELSGYKLCIRSDTHPGIIFTIFHAALTVPPTVGDVLTAGQQIGTHDLGTDDSDIAVGVVTPLGWQLISFVETTTDALFAAYQLRGLTLRTDVVYDPATRDADPLTCDANGDFVFPPPDPLAAYYLLN